jgi:hypothetical protein
VFDTAVAHAWPVELVNQEVWFNTWVDIPGDPARKRQTVALGICKTKSSARQRLREYLDRKGVNSKKVFEQNTAPAITFRLQAECGRSQAF